MNDFINEKVLPIAGKIQNNKWLSCISASFMQTMPVLMAGAIFSLIQGLPLGDWYTNLLADTGLTALLAAVVEICNLTAVFFIVSLGYQLGKMKNQNAFHTAILALFSFLIITPVTTTVFDEVGTATLVSGVLPLANLEAQGIFTALIVGIISVSIYAFCMDRNMRIKMPASVPEMVPKPFEAVVPAFLAVVVFVIIRAGFSATSFGTLQGFIYDIVQTPLVGLGNSFGAMLICIFITCLMWWLGIHGTAVVLSIMMVIWQEPAIENLNNFMAGLPVENIIGMMFYFIIIQFVGGPGCMLGLHVDMFIFAKSKRYKTFGKMAIVPGAFNIVEPMIFGFPIVLNPIMFIPFVFTPVIFAIAAYFLMSTGMVGIPALMLSVMTIPGPVAGFLLGGGISLGIMLIVMALLSCVIYYPFFKISDAQALKQEKEMEEAEAASEAIA